MRAYQYDIIDDDPQDAGSDPYDEETLLTFLVSSTIDRLGDDRWQASPYVILDDTLIGLNLTSGQLLALSTSRINLNIY